MMARGLTDGLVWNGVYRYRLLGLYAPVAQMDQSGRFLNGKSRFDSVREHHHISQQEAGGSDGSIL
jgi:hypothetical protein